MPAMPDRQPPTSAPYPHCADTTGLSSWNGATKPQTPSTNKVTKLLPTDVALHMEPAGRRLPDSAETP